MTTDEEARVRGACAKCYGGSDEGCVGGAVYGYCSSEACDGICEYVGRCDCRCHSEEAEQRD